MAVAVTVRVAVTVTAKVTATATVAPEVALRGTSPGVQMVRSNLVGVCIGCEGCCKAGGIGAQKGI